MDTPVRRVSFEELPQIGQLPQIVNTLKKRLIDQMKKSYSQDIVSDTCTDQEEEDEHVNNRPVYVNTYAGPSVDDTVVTLSQVQMMLDGMKQHEDCDTSHKIEQQSPSRSGIFRSLSHDYTPLIIESLQNRPESYHPINIDSALQDDDGYAPVSVIMRHGKPVRKLGKRATSLRTRLSIFRDKSKNNTKDGPTDYEIPLNLSPFLMMNDKLPIPPPKVIKSCQLNLSRQNAMKDKSDGLNSQTSTDSDHHDYSQTTQIDTPSKTSTHQISKPSSLSTSEPYLNNSNDDYDYLEKLPGSPTKAVTLPRSPSPTKALLERARTAPVLRPYLLYGKNDSDDYDVLLSTEAK